jgi:hypothetical protein
MSKEKIQSLTKYANDLKSKLSEKNIPEKQKNRPAQYKQFLEKELTATTVKIDSLKMTAPADLAKK